MATEKPAAALISQEDAATLLTVAETAYLLLDGWLHSGNLPDREFAYATRDGLRIELAKHGSEYV